MVRLKEGQFKKVKLTILVDPRDKETIDSIALEETETGHESNESVVARRMLHTACEEYRKKKASGG